MSKYYNKIARQYVSCIFFIIYLSACSLENYDSEASYTVTYQLFKDRTQQSIGCRLLCTESNTHDTQTIHLTQWHDHHTISFLEARKKHQWYGDITCTPSQCDLSTLDPQKSIVEILNQSSQSLQEAPFPQLKSESNLKLKIESLWDQWSTHQWSFQILNQNYRILDAESMNSIVSITPWHLLASNFQHLSSSLSRSQKEKLIVDWNSLWGIKDPWYMVDHPSHINRNQNLQWMQLHQDVRHLLHVDSIWEFMQIVGFLIELKDIIQSISTANSDLDLVQIWYADYTKALQIAWAESWRMMRQGQVLDQTDWMNYYALLTIIPKIYNYFKNISHHDVLSRLSQEALLQTLDQKPVIHWVSTIPKTIDPMINSKYFLHLQAHGVSASLDRLEVFYRDIDGLKPLVNTYSKIDEFKSSFQLQAWTRNHLEIHVKAWDIEGRFTEDIHQIYIQQPSAQLLNISGHVIDWEGGGIIQAFAWPIHRNKSEYQTALKQQDLVLLDQVVLNESASFRLSIPRITQEVLFYIQPHTLTKRWHAFFQEYQAVVQPRFKWFTLDSESLHTPSSTSTMTHDIYLVVDRLGEMFPVVDSFLTQWQDRWQKNQYHSSFILDSHSQWSHLFSHQSSELNQSHWDQLTPFLQKRYALHACIQGRDLWWQHTQDEQINIDQALRIRHQYEATLLSEVESMWLSSLILGCGVAQVFIDHSIDWHSLILDEVTQLITISEQQIMIDFHSIWLAQNWFDLDEQYTQLDPNDTQQTVWHNDVIHRVNLNTQNTENQLYVISELPLCYHPQTQKIYSHAHDFYLYSYSPIGITSLLLDSNLTIHADWYPKDHCHLIADLDMNEDMIIQNIPTAPCFWSASAPLQDLYDDEIRVNWSIDRDVNDHSIGWKSFMNQITYPLSCNVYTYCELSPLEQSHRYEMMVQITPWFFSINTQTFQWHTVDDDLSLNTTLENAQLLTQWDAIPPHQNSNSEPSSQLMIHQSQPWSLTLALDRHAYCELSPLASHEISIADQALFQSYGLHLPNRLLELNTDVHITHLTPEGDQDDWNQMICSSSINSTSSQWMISSNAVAQTGIRKSRLHCQDQMMFEHRQDVYWITDQTAPAITHLNIQFYHEADYNAQRDTLDDESMVQIDLQSNDFRLFELSQNAFQHQVHISTQPVMIESWFDRWSAYICQQVNQALNVDLLDYCTQDSPIWLEIDASDDLWQDQQISFEIELWQMQEDHVMNLDENIEPQLLWQRLNDQATIHSLYAQRPFSGESNSYIKLDLKALWQAHHTSLPTLTFPSLENNHLKYYLHLQLNDPSGHTTSRLIPLVFTSILPSPLITWQETGFPSLQDRWQHGDWSLFTEDTWGTLQIHNPHSIPLWLQIHTPLHPQIHAQVQEYDYGFKLDEQNHMDSCLFDSIQQRWMSSVVHLNFELQNQNPINGYCAIRPQYQIEDLLSSPRYLYDEWYLLNAYGTLTIPISMPQWNLSYMLSIMLNITENTQADLPIELRDTYALFEDFALYWRELALCDLCEIGLFFGTPYIHLESLTWSHEADEHWSIELQYFDQFTSHPNQDSAVSIRTHGKPLQLPWPTELSYSVAL